MSILKRGKLNVELETFKKSIVSMVTMATTIQISEKTKAELFLIKSQLELTTGQKYSLEDAIKWLMASGKNKSIEERRETAEELLGIAKSIGLNLADVSDLRMQRNSRFENY